MKVLRCRDAGFDCDAQVRGETDEEIFGQVGPHAASEHGVEELTPELQTQLQGLIREE